MATADASADGGSTPRLLLPPSGDRAGDVDAFLENLLHAVRLHLGMEVAFVSEFTDGQRIFRVVDAEVPTPVRAGEGGPLEDSYCQRVVDGRLPQLIHDAARIPEAAALPVTSALPVGAHVSVPIVLSDRTVYGTFCCFDREPDLTLRERDLAVMHAFADVAAARIESERAESLRRRGIEAEVHRAIAGEILTVAYQPIVDLAAGGPVGYEALARFTGAPPRGPAEWFDRALEVGLREELELEAVRRALRGLPDLPRTCFLSVNVSPTTIARGIDQVLRGAAPDDRVVVEITEHAPIEAYDDLLAALAELRSRGVRVAIDDAGAGYASFRHILRIAPDIIKLDMTLTRDIDSDRAKHALALALIEFAGTTKATIVAEGVETAGELDALRALGVRLAQGYYLGRPAPIDASHAPTPDGDRPEIDGVARLAETGGFEPPRELNTP